MTVLAVGDSLTSGYGVPVGGLRCRSWAAWLAWALVAPLVDHAVDGATTQEVVRDQLPLVQGTAAVACTVIGANDVRLGRTGPTAAAARELLEGLAAHADAVVVAAPPRRLLPGMGGASHAGRLAEVEAAVQQAASGTGAHWVELGGALGRPFEVGPDRLHPSATGHLALARRAALVLAAAGVPLRRHLPDGPGLRPTTAQLLAWVVEGAAHRLPGG